MRYYLDVLLELPLAQRILFTVAVVLALAALDYALVYRGQAGRIEHATEEIELARLDEARLRAELGRLPQLRQEVAALRRELHSHVPRPGASSTPLENISAQAAIAGLEVIRFHPGEARPGEHFTEVPTEVELKGTFHDLLRFFEFSAGSHDVLNATDLAIGALAAEDGHTMLRIALEMATLRVPPEEADTVRGGRRDSGDEHPCAGRESGADVGWCRHRTLAPGPVSAIRGPGSTRAGRTTETARAPGSPLRT